MTRARMGYLSHGVCRIARLRLFMFWGAVLAYGFLALINSCRIVSTMLFSALASNPPSAASLAIRT
jgi:hypothetical protein